MSEQTLTPEQQEALTTTVTVICCSCGLFEGFEPDYAYQDSLTGEWVGAIDKYKCSDCGSTRGQYLR